MIWKKGDRVKVMENHASPEAVGLIGVISHQPSSELNPVLRVVIDREQAEKHNPGILEWEINATADHFELADEATESKH